MRFSQALRASLSIYVVFFAAIAACISLSEIVLWLPSTSFPKPSGCFKNPSGRVYLPVTGMAEAAVGLGSSSG